jgi:hypothetical protein
MGVVRIDGLDADPLAAAAFHAVWLPLLSPAGDGEDLVLIFSPADHTHSAWRLAAVQGLARAHVPARVNALASADEAAIAAALAYLAAAVGVTGQYLPLDGAGAGPVLSSAA